MSAFDIFCDHIYVYVFLYSMPLCW